MGFNTTILVLNDYIHTFDSPDFGAKLRDAIKRVVGEEPVEIPGHGVTVIETHHADETAVVAVGGNTAYKMLATHGSPMSEDSRLRFLKEMAEEMGYIIAKKRDPKPLTKSKPSVTDGDR